MNDTFYALRYVAGTPFAERKHEHTLGRWETYDAADTAREARPHPERLEVVVRGGESA